MNAMRSRCWGSMFAWILKTKPLNRSSPGATVRCSGGARLRPRRQLDERVEKLPDPEVVECGAEEDGRLGGGAIRIDPELVAGAANELHLLAQLAGLLADPFVDRGVVDALDHLPFHDPPVVARAEEADPVVEQVMDAPEPAPAPDRPGHRRAPQAEHPFDLVEQLDGLPALAVQLVHERDDRRVAQPADLHQADGPRLHAAGRVDDHEGRVDGGQGSVGVFGEVLVAGGVQQIDDSPGVRKLHHRRGDGDAPLLLELHPVGGRVPRRPASLDGAGEPDRSAEQQQLLGEGGLARIGVGDDRERAPAFDLLQGVMIRHGRDHRAASARAGTARSAGWNRGKHRGAKHAPMG